MIKNKKITHIMTILLIVMLLFILNYMNLAYANTNIDSAYLYTTGNCGRLLNYKGVEVIAHYVEYKKDGVAYPAYCLDKTKSGVEDNKPYTVSVQEMINDVELWKIIINGYPYKSIEQLGVANKEEAFLATKQAIYCYIHGNNPADYSPIGEAGNRTLNALKNILANAQNSTETKISNTITINRVSEKWEQDSIDKNYVSKTYSILKEGQIKDYQITIESEDGTKLGGIKVTDETNKEKNTFNPNENFKILIPIKEMKENKQIKINVKAEIETKPILYGKAPNSGLQDYALTTATYEDGTGYINEEYQKNDTKIKIIKQDSKTAEKLEGVEFEVLNENKEVIYSGLKTNKNGEIILENLIPQKYFIKETKTIDGYEIYDKLIEVNVGLNEELTVTINNNQEEKPTIEKIQKNQQELEIKEKNCKKLPVTGK